MARLGIALLVGLALFAASAERDEHNWSQWRGPLATGVALHGAPPIHWDAHTNIKWRCAIPGEGHGTPIVWGDQVFVSAAIPVGEQRKPLPDSDPGAHNNRPVTQEYEFRIYAIDRDSGELRWQQLLCRALPREGGHETGTVANNSPVTDGEQLIVSLGSRGLYGLNLSGQVLWKTDLSELVTRHNHGEGSSPALYGNHVVVNLDHEGDSFIAAYDKRSGKRFWRRERDEMTSWSSPIIVHVDGKPQVIVSATGRVRGYDLHSGEELWTRGGLSRNVVASPVAGHGLVFASNSYDWQALLAIRLSGARGELGAEHLAWSLRRNTSYVPSPLLLGDTLYLLGHNQGILTGIHAPSGRVSHGPFRLDAIRNVFASPVAAAGHIYIADLDGTTLVLKHGEHPEPVAVNRLDDSFAASPAIAGNELFLRGKQTLYCIATTRKKILMLGNSYTAQTAGHIRELFKAEAPEYDFTVISPGGKDLAFHLENSAAQLQHESWDVLVLQEQSQKPGLPGKYRDSFHASVAEFAKRVQPGTRIVLFRTWGRRDGDSKNPDLYPDFSTMNDILGREYRKAADSNNTLLAPIGDAFAAYRQSHPDHFAELYRKDGSHPSVRAGYLAGCVLLQTITGRPPADIRWQAKLDLSTAAALRAAAANASRN
jgi:outer membrane protein assembly factor BamB